MARKHCKCCSCGMEEPARGMPDDFIWLKLKEVYEANKGPIDLDWLAFAGRCTFGEPERTTKYGQPALRWTILGGAR